MTTTTQNILIGLGAFAAGAFLFRSKSAVGNVREYPKLRSVEVTYSTGDIIATSMAAHLTDDDIFQYFRIGKVFNIGNGVNDKLARVTNVKILDSDAHMGTVMVDRNGFTSIEIKMPGMKKAAEWTIYPYKGGDDLILQNSTRIMQVNLRTGLTMLSKARSSGAYFHDLLSIRGATNVMMPTDSLIQLQKHLWDNEGKSGGGPVVSWDNKELFS